MAEVYQHDASQIMQKCSQALLREQSLQLDHFGLGQHSHQAFKKDQLKELFVSTINSCITPHQESQNNKIIDKLRKKNNKKKNLKQVLIRKTDLGQNQLIFTKDELDKLKIIDQEELYGITPNPTPPSPLQNLINVITTGEKGDKKYFVNPNFDNAQGQISNYLCWVDMRELKKNQDKKKSKILNFQKRERSPSNDMDQLNKMPRQTLPVLMPKHSSPFKNMKNLQLNKAKSCHPLIKKNSVDKGFLNSINVNDSEEKRQGEKEKLNEILFKANQYIEKQFGSCHGSRKYIYMTEDRKQALYECEVLRRVKRQIGPKFYQNLQLTYGNKLPAPKGDEDYLDYEKENDDKGENISTKLNQNKTKLNKTQSNNFARTRKQKNYIGQKQKMVFESQAERMIHKNRNRLKEERKRVIQRIVC